MNHIDLAPYKANKKTAFLAEEYLRLLAERKSVEATVAADPQLSELAKSDLENFDAQMKTLEAQMIDLSQEEKEETESPSDLVLEIRAGAGGEEAALFAAQL